MWVCLLSCDITEHAAVTKAKRPNSVVAVKYMFLFRAQKYDQMFDTLLSFSLESERLKANGNKIRKRGE